MLFLSDIERRFLKLSDNGFQVRLWLGDKEDNWSAKDLAKRPAC